MRPCFELEAEMEVKQQKIVEAKKSKCVNVLKEVKFGDKEFDFFAWIANVTLKEGCKKEW